MKRLFLLFTICLAVSSAAAKKPSATQADNVVGEYPITSRISLSLGNIKIANHFFSAQEFSGFICGLDADFGRFYRKSENVSWNLSLGMMRRKNGTFIKGLPNFAGTNNLSFQGYDVNYSSHYNWLLTDGLSIKAGGGLNIYGDWGTMTQYQMNNARSANLLVQLEASAGIYYVAELKKANLGIYGNIATPFLGFVFTDSMFENGWSSMLPDNIGTSYEKHLKGTTPHNLQGLNANFGLDIITQKVTVSFGYQTQNRWWYVNDVQNYRKSSFFTIGLGFRFVAHQHTKSTRRFF